MKVQIKEGARRLVAPLVSLLAGLGVSPDAVTALGVMLSFAAGGALAFQRYLPATLFLVGGSVCDMLDGGLARRTGKATRFGAFLDSTMDRYAEMAVFLGIAVGFARQPDLPVVAVTIAAAGGSFLVSYARARAEGLGLDCKVGLMERPERLLVLIVACALGRPVMRYAVWGLAVLVHITVIQRILFVRSELARQGE